MKKGTTKAIAATALTVVSLLAASGAQATLFTRLNGQAVYDDVAKLTWLQDANYAKTSGYDGDGRMTWSTAMAWASNLVIDGVAGWHLPDGPMESGFNQTASEMGNLYYNVLGGVVGAGISAPYNANYNLFQNIQSSYYWSGVEVGSGGAWYFSFAGGYQFNPGGGGTSDLFAWAVHDGDVGGNPVPAPGTLALLVAGLFGWAGVKRARRAGA